MLKINDLNRHNYPLLNDLCQISEDVLKSGWYILGKEVDRFESEFAQYCGVSCCISLANGSDALEIALKAVGVEPGDKVITVSNAGGYSTIAILACGALPVYVDIDDSHLISIESLDKIVSLDIKAIIVTHLYGQTAPVDKIISLLSNLDLNIPIVEDCAQAHGAILNGLKVGSLGDIGCFSFYPTKNLGGIGDGGAITTNNKKIAERVKMLRQYGWSNKYEIEIIGGRNSRLDEIQAAFLRYKLKRLDEWNDKRFHICDTYLNNIKNQNVKLPTIEKKSFVGHLFVIRCSQRESLRNFLKSHNIMTDIHYPIPDHLQKAVANYPQHSSLENTEIIANQILTLPCFPEMSEEEIMHVTQSVNKWIPT